MLREKIRQVDFYTGTLVDFLLMNSALSIHWVTMHIVSDTLFELFDKVRCSFSSLRLIFIPVFYRICVTLASCISFLLIHFCHLFFLNYICIPKPKTLKIIYPCTFNIIVNFFARINFLWNMFSEILCFLFDNCIWFWHLDLSKSLFTISASIIEFLAWNSCGEKVFKYFLVYSLSP